jgi:hypothetical protein
MWNYIWVSLVAGVLFGALDGFINMLPPARRLLTAYGQVVRPSVNVTAGVIIDLAYGFVMAGLFLLLYRSLPGAAGWTKGLSFGVLAWFFRVLMSVLSQWMMFKLPLSGLAYTLFGGLGEMLLIGLFLGITLRPAA